MLDQHRSQQLGSALYRSPGSGLGDCAGRRGRRDWSISGLALLIRELTRPVPDPGTPPRTSIRLAPRSRKRLLIAAGTGVVTLALTRWPVAMIAAALAVLFLPRAHFRPSRHSSGPPCWRAWSSGLGGCPTCSPRAGAWRRRWRLQRARRPPRSSPPVTALGRRMAARTGTEAALRAFAADIDDPAADRIAAALIIATGHRGGAVRDVLNALAVMLAADVAARREIEADRAQHRTTVKWLTLFVLGFTVFAVLNRSYSRRSGHSPGR